LSNHINRQTQVKTTSIPAYVVNRNIRELCIYARHLRIQQLEYIDTIRSAVLRQQC